MTRERSSLEPLDPEAVHPTIWNLWSDLDDADQILVDVPIGLPEEERRACDSEAQTQLGSRASSVFLTPIRQAVYRDNVEEAKALHEEVDAGYSISNQAWAIVPRIREVDTFLRETADARETVRESHPEVCFRALGDDEKESIAGKLSDEGVQARREVLESNTPIAGEDLDRAVAVLAEPSYARFAAADDVLDAIALAVTAKHVADGEYSTLPGNPPEDDAGLPVEIVYPDP